MKKLLFISALFLVSFGYGQEKEKPFIQKISDVKVTSLTFTIDSPEDLKSIDWKDIKEMFSYNTYDEQKIKFTFNYNLPKSKNKIKGSITIGGEQKDIESLIKRAKKMTKSLVKIVNKNKK